MKGRIEKMPSVTSARVAKVQKKSLERKAWKKAISAGSRRAASTVTTPLVTKTATTGHSQSPSWARRIAKRAMRAGTKEAAASIGAGGPRTGADRAGFLIIGCTVTATTEITRVMIMISATTP